MPSQTLKLTSFTFPAELPDNRANFRVVFDVKYWVGLGDAAKLKMANSIKPGIDTFWECDMDRVGRANFVRRINDEGTGFAPAVDVDGLAPWDREIITLDTTGLHSVRVKIYDVDRKGFWDKIKGTLGAIVEGVFGAGSRGASAAVPDALSDATGGSIDEISSYLVKKLSGGSDKVLFQKSDSPDTQGVVTISGMGTNGRGGTGPYELVLAFARESPPQESAG